MLRKDTVIINLGAIVAPNIQMALDAYAELIAKKSWTDIKNVKSLIGNVLFANMGVINQFKDGLIDEENFNELMIAALKDATGVELTVDEFDACWHKQHPAYEDFAESLNQAIAYAKKSDKKLIFTSYTNPKDMRNLIVELTMHKVSFTAINLQLTEIAGIDLHLTYVEQKPLDVMIADLIKKLKSHRSQSTLIDSMRSFLGSDESRMPPNIIYISTPNDIKELTLRADLDKTMSEIEKMRRYYSIDSVVWDKSKQSLEKVFEGLQPSYKLAV